MSETYEKVTVKTSGQTLSKIIWRRFRKPVEGIRERTLNHNPGLAALGPVLPVGTTFEIVVPGPEEAIKNMPVIRLWGTSE